MNNNMSRLVINIRNMDQCHECHEAVTNYLVTLLTNNHQHFRDLSLMSLTFITYIFI
jgi:hypothetical protein